MEIIIRGTPKDVVSLILELQGWHNLVSSTKIACTGITDARLAEITKIAQEEV